MAGSIFSEELIKPDRPLRLRSGSLLEFPISARRSLLYPGHTSLIARLRVERDLPVSARNLAEEQIDLSKCRFCHPDTLCAESQEERSSVWLGDTEFILARTPYYYFPGHYILFPKTGPHLLSEVKETDWSLLLDAGVKVALTEPYLRIGFNVGTYLCSGGSQRHLHIQLVPFRSLAPREEGLQTSMPKGASYDELHAAFDEKELIVESSSGGEGFLAACWAPRFNLELVAVFSRINRFKEMNSNEAKLLASWICGVTKRFVIPHGGGINGYGLEVPGLPFMVRLIPRLPGAVHAFLETGAGCMVISYLPETIPDMWRS